MEGLVIIVASIFTANIALTNFLGMCPFIAISKDYHSAMGMGAAVTFVLTITSMVNWIINNYILVPFGVEYLQFVVFIIVIASLVQIVEMFVERVSPTLYNALGIFLPLITVNCAILGVSLFMILRNYNFIKAVSYGFGGGLGWSLAIISMASIRNRLQYADIPRQLQGPGITMITAGLMALGFIGFTGIVNIQ